MIQMENNEVKNPNWKEMDQMHGSYKILGEKIKALSRTKIINFFFKDVFSL